MTQSLHTENVLIFHGIGQPKRALEPGEAVYWLSEPDFRDILDQIAGMGDHKPHITFDDGNVSDVAIALPELNKRGLRATFFLLTGRLGQPGGLSDKDVAILAQSGHQIGLHGHAHRDWRALNPDERITEFRTARQRLEALSGQPVTLAAAPFGFYDRSVIAHLKAEGFTALYTSDYGPAQADAFIQPRNCVETDLSQDELSRLLTGRVALVRKPRRFLGIARKRLLPIRWPA